jgi:hypothetical protein
MSTVNSGGSFFEESTLGKSFTQCLILGGLGDRCPWSQLLLYSLFVQCLIRSQQYDEISVIAGDGDFRVFRRLLSSFCDELECRELQEDETGHLSRAEIMSKYKEYESIDDFLTIHHVSNDDASNRKSNKSLAVIISQFSDILINSLFPSSSITSSSNATSLLRKVQQLPRFLGHVPSPSPSSASSVTSSAVSKSGWTRKLHIFAACCTTLHPPTTVQLLASHFPSVVRIHPNDGTFYASVVAAEVHTIRRADVTQKITENSELFVFGPCFPPERMSSIGRTNRPSGPSQEPTKSSSTGLLLLWPLVAPNISSTTDSSAAQNSPTPTPATASSIPSSTGSTLATKRLITFDRSDPEFDEDDDPDADLDL